MKLSKAFKNVLRGKRHNGTELPKGILGVLKSDNIEIPMSMERQEHAIHVVYGGRWRDFYMDDYPTEEKLFSAIEFQLATFTGKHVFGIRYYDMNKSARETRFWEVRFKSPSPSAYNLKEQARRAAMRAWQAHTRTLTDESLAVFWQAFKRFESL